MNFGDMVEIKDISGKTRFSTPINKGAKGKFTLMKEDYIILPFSVQEPVYFKVGDYIDLSNIEFEGLGGKVAKVYEIIDINNVSPTYNESTGAYDYNIRLDAYYWKWKNKIFKYTPENAGQEASWSLTAALDVHLGVLLRNLKALGYTYKGTEFTFSIDSTVENKAVAVTYDNTNLLDALFMLAGESYYNCDCWITDNVIHFGRNEFGDAVKIERGVEALSIGKAESKGTYATRIYAFGGTRNIPTNYRPTEEQTVVNGVVQKRLMLPKGTPYIDAYTGMTTEEAIEDVVVFDDVYPRRIGTMSDITTVDRDIVDSGETVGTFKAYQYKDLGLNFSEDYIIDGQELKIRFQSGKLNGLEFSVQFNPNGEDPAEQLWEIVRNEDYGRPLPDDVMKPESDDTYVLSGFDIQLVSDQYIPEAEQELLERAKEYANMAKKDDGTYPVTLFSDYVYSDQLRHNYEFGQKVNLIDKAYFPEGRISRILGWEINLDIPYDSPKYTVGESMPYSRIGELEQKIDALIYKGQTYTGSGGGSGVYVIRTNDSTAASDSNVFSALRSLAMFLRRDKPDETKYLFKFLAGALTDDLQSLSFTAGPFGTGYLLKRDPKTGKSYMEIDELYVRLKAYFDTLEIKHLSHVGGRIVLSPASMECNKVEIVSGESESLSDSLGSKLYDSDNEELKAVLEGGEKVYRCYFNNDDGEKKIVNEFAIDDLAQCRTFNVKEGVSENVSNQYYWRRVVGLGSNYIDLSIYDCDAGSTEPKAGDTIVTIGNKTDANRQNVIYLSSYDDDAPSIKLYSGINNYSMLNKEVSVVSPNADKNLFTGRVLIKPGSRGFSNFEDAPDIEDINNKISEATQASADAMKAINNLESNVNDFNDYVDGAFRDGIISSSEAVAIESYINTIQTTKKEVDATYSAIVSSEYINDVGDLVAKKLLFDNAINKLITSIDTAISDGKTTSEEKLDVDNKFDEFNNAYAALAKSIEDANKVIQSNLKQAAIDQSIEANVEAIRQATIESADDMAKKLGYPSYQDMSAAAERKETLISGGKINTSLIEADAIVTSLLIANAIKAQSLNINDKTFIRSDGTFETIRGIMQDMVLSGAFRSPFRPYDFSWNNPSVKENILQDNNNVIVCPMEGESFSFNLPVGDAYNGFVATILNGDLNGRQPTYKAVLSCALPIFEDGQRYNAIHIDPYEGIEILGLTTGAGFLGWVVKKRFMFGEVSEGYSTLDVQIIPEGAGTVDGAGTYPTGSTIPFTAYPAEGYKFVKWEVYRRYDNADGGLIETSTSNPFSTKCYDNRVKAYFEMSESMKVTISATVSPEGKGRVDGVGSYFPGETVTLEAVKTDNEYSFVRWNDSNTDNPRTIIASQNLTLTAFYEKYSFVGGNILEFASNKIVAETQSGSVSLTVIGNLITVKPTTDVDVCTIVVNKGYLSGKVQVGRRYVMSVNTTSNPYASLYLMAFGNTDDISVTNTDEMQSLSNNGASMGRSFVANRTTTTDDALRLIFVGLKANSNFTITLTKLEEYIDILNVESGGHKVENYSDFAVTSTDKAVFFKNQGAAADNVLISLGWSRIQGRLNRDDKYYCRLTIKSTSSNSKTIIVGIGDNKKDANLYNWDNIPNPQLPNGSIAGDFELASTVDYTYSSDSFTARRMSNKNDSMSLLISRIEANEEIRIMNLGIYKIN